MDEGRFSISADNLYQRLGSAAAPIVIDVRRVPAFSPAAMVAIVRLKTGTFQTLLACSAAGLFSHFVGAIG